MAVAEAITLKNMPHVIYVDPRKNNGERPIAINMADRSVKDLKFKLKESKTRWDFLSTLKPPENLSIESGNIFRIDHLP